MPSPTKENAMLWDVMYTPPSKADGTPDKLMVVWKDLDTGQKYLNVTDSPSMDIYFTKPEFRNHTYNKNYESIDRLERRRVKYRNIPYEIADEMGVDGQAIIQRARDTKNFSALRELHFYRYAYATDFDVRAWYRIKWKEMFDNERIKPIDKGFLDIEVDGLLHKGMPTPQTCPVNAVTIINQKTKESYTFLLMTPDEFRLNKPNMTEEDFAYERRINEFYDMQRAEQQRMMDNPGEFIQELHEAFDTTYGYLDYNIKFYKDERKMLVHIWQLINMWKLDMIGIWNMPFDIPYILERMEFLGLDPKEYACHPDFPVKRCYFKKDDRNFNVENKSDFFYLTSYTLFVDQMVLYAATRKGGTKLRSYRLNYIADRVLGDKKIDYSEDGSIKDLAYKAFRKFVMYNIKDVLLQYGIEDAVNDMDAYYIASYSNATPYESVFKQTVKLRNVQYLYFLEQGLIPGNNINIFNKSNAKAESEDDDDDSFEGALVADPKYNDYIGLDLYGKPSNNIFELVIDMDMSAFYPSSIMAMNIDPSCLIFKTIVSSSQFVKQEVGYNSFIMLPEDEDIGKDVFDNIQTGNVLYTGHKWFNLPSFEDVLKECERKLK